MEPFYLKQFMIPLTDTELKYLCEYLSITEYIYYPIATQYFADLYNTGCRPKELLAYNRWDYISDSEILLTPFKGNDVRTFTADDLSPSLLYSVVNQIAPYDGLTYRQLKAVLFHIIPVLLPQTEDKSAIDYIFRYNKVRTLLAAGKTLAEVQSIFGWFTSAYVTLYSARALFVSTPVPDYIYPTITDNSDNLLTDSDGAFILYQ